MIVERRLSVHIDWPLIAAILALTFIGLLTIYSVTWDFRPGHDQPGREFWTQLYALPVGLLAMFAVHGHRLPDAHAAVADPVRAASSRRSLRCRCSATSAWARAAGLPCPDSRCSLPSSAASCWRWCLPASTAKAGAARGPSGISPWAASSSPFRCCLILQQPDLGTAATLIPVYVGVIFVTGLRMKWLAIAALMAALLSPLVWAFVLQDYQKERIQTFIDPVEGRPRQGPAADSGQGHRRVRRVDREGIPAGHAGRLRVPARRAQRLRLLGLGRRTRVSRASWSPSGSISSS